MNTCLVSAISCFVKSVIFYAAGFLISLNLILAWFHSNFAQHLWNRLHPGNVVYTKDDLAVAAVVRYGDMGDLWLCPICLGTWLSLLTAVGVVLSSAAPWQLIPLGTLTWPGLAYIIHRKL